MLRSRPGGVLKVTLKGIWTHQRTRQIIQNNILEPKNQLNFTIRPAKPSDIDGIMKIESSSFIEEIQESEKVFLERIETFSKGFLLFETAGRERPAGYFSTELWAAVPQTENTFKIGHSIKSAHKTDGKVLYISSFAILPEYRGNGNGKKLFSQALEYIKKQFDLETLVLLVNTEWAGAQHIYSSYGFKEIFRIKNIFPAKNNQFTDGIVMTL